MKYESEAFKQLKREIVLAKERGLSIIILARESGINPNTICKWMDGTVKEPQLSTMIKVANRLGKDFKLVNGQARFFPAKRPRFAVWLRQ